MLLQVLVDLHDGLANPRGDVALDTQSATPVDLSVTQLGHCNNNITKQLLNIMSVDTATR